MGFFPVVVKLLFCLCIWLAEFVEDLNATFAAVWRTLAALRALPLPFLFENE
jgi:hypothetical protein